MTTLAQGVFLAITLSFPFIWGEEQAALESIAKSVTIQKNRLDVGINDSFKESWLMGDFFAEYEPDIDLEKIPYSIALSPFIITIYPIVWISGKNYSIECMDFDIYHSLKKIKKILQRLYPHTPLRGNLIPQTLVHNTPACPLINPKEGVAVLFSGGLDSTACSFQHSTRKQLLLSVQGQEDLPLKYENLWGKVKRMFISYAREYGHTNAFVRSNHAGFLKGKVLHSISPEIISWRVDTTEGIGLFGLVLPILFTKGYTQLLIGSSFTWEFPYPTAANPFVDNNLKAARRFKLHHEHFTHTRFDKVKLIVDRIKENNLKIPFLKVCNYKKNAKNCCYRCTKCQTVLMGLIALGENPRPYGFNIDTQEALNII